MCLLSYYPPGVAPDEEALRAGVAINGDGFGWAVHVPPGQVVSARTLDGEEAVTGFMEYRAAHPGGPALFHSRWLTAGDGGVERCHPYHVPGVGVMAHNGTWPGLARGGSPDSQVLAEEVLPAYDGRWDELVVPEGNRLVIITLAGEGVLIGEEGGLWVGGVWHSSADCVPPGDTPPQPKVTLRLLYRQLGLQQYLGVAGAGEARAALLAEFPALRYGQEVAGK